jgi:hypothetical protein
MDINPPYSPDVQKAVAGEKSAENASRLRPGNVMVERWQKLAGLIE